MPNPNTENIIKVDLLTYGTGGADLNKPSNTSHTLCPGGTSRTTGMDPITVETFIGVEELIVATFQACVIYQLVVI